jgi:hypothetical protein
MEKWLRIGQPQVQEILDHDPDFQKMLSELEGLEAQYQQVLQKLSSADQEIVERYIGLCEELEYQKTHTAYKCGRMHRSS